MRRRTKTIALTAIVAAAMLGSTLGCGEDPPPPPPPKHDFTLEVEVTDTDENPLPSVPVTLDGKVVGHTDKDGKFAGTLRETAGTDVTLGVEDIPGYRFVNEATSVTETLKTTTVNGTKSGIPLYLQIQAESITKDYMVWIEVKCEDSLEGQCEGLPVMLDGEEVAKTNRLGFAHFSFADVPQNDVMVTIDTPDPEGDSEEQPFEPADPEYALTLDLDSHIYMVDETFEAPGAAKKEVKKRRRRPRRARRARSNKPKKSAPKKAPKTAPKKKKKDDGGGVIDLW